jgi:transaldolase
MLELFNIKYGASNSKSIARITGDTDSTAGLADVMAFENFGVQVKNFNEFGSTKNVGATTNPALLTKYFDNQAVAQDVRLFLANYFFNDTFKKNKETEFTNLSNDISQLHYALLSLSVSDTD